MAVVWADRRIGAASQAMVVRDPLVAEALLPRYLAPGDEARLAVRNSTVQVPDAAPADSATGRLIAAPPMRGGAVSLNTCPFGRRIVTRAARSSGAPAASRSSAITCTVSPAR